MNVYLSVGDLDIRNASGMELPVVREADNDWYSSGEISSVYQGKEPDYKFVYTADGPGVQRVYFENILNQETATRARSISKPNISKRCGASSNTPPISYPSRCRD